MYFCLFIVFNELVTDVTASDDCFSYLV